MIVYTMGFTKKTARQFFEQINKNRIDILIDIRLNNKSQLAGFTKGEDLEFFLRKICNCDYEHCDEYAPTKEILDCYKKKIIELSEYEKRYIPLMERRNATTTFWNRFSKYQTVCLLCSEPTPEKCHRRLLAEMIARQFPEVVVKHI